MSYGEAAKTRKRFQGFYGPMPGKRGLISKWDGAGWVLPHSDLDTFVKDHLDAGERQRHRALS